MYTSCLQQPGIHPDSSLYHAVIAAFAACSAPHMVLQVTLIMAQQV